MPTRIKGLEVAVKAHAVELAKITVVGGIAVFVFEPDNKGSRAAREMGWDKYSSPMFRMSLEMEQRLAVSDTVTRRWIERPVDGVHRLFVIAHGGTLLMNLSEERGWWLEEGSTEAELKQTRS